MKIFSMKRGTGKTTLLIIISHFTNARIITATKTSAKYVQNLANKMNFSITKPMSWYEYYECKDIKGEKILIDELDNILYNIFGSLVLAATLTEED